MPESDTFDTSDMSDLSGRPCAPVDSPRVNWVSGMSKVVKTGHNGQDWPIVPSVGPKVKKFSASNWKVISAFLANIGTLLGVGHTLRSQSLKHGIFKFPCPISLMYQPNDDK